MLPMEVGAAGLIDCFRPEADMGIANPAKLSTWNASTAPCLMRWC